MTTLAHLGGVPEALSILVPLALVIVLLRIGAKRMPANDDGGDDDAPPADGTAGPGEAAGPDGPDGAGPDDPLGQQRI